MKTATAALIDLLNTVDGNKLVEFDFFTFTLADGTQLRYGAAPFKIRINDSAIWNPPAIDGSGGMYSADISWEPSAMGAANDWGSIGRWTRGLNADSFSLRFVPRLEDPVTGDAFPDTINGMPWLQAAQNGALEHADVIVSTAYFAAMPEAPISPLGVVPVGTLVITRGLVGPVDCSDTAAFLQISDYRVLLDEYMPRNLYQAQCRHRVFGTRCGLDAATYTKTGTVITADGCSIVATAAIAAPAGSGTFTLGVMTMTSGDNDNVSRTVVKWDGAAAFTLLAPFPYDIAPGDTFSVTAGCNKTTATCNAFGNISNFGGFPYIPQPEVAVG